jgi:hypothetical protein
MRTSRDPTERKKGPAPKENDPMKAERQRQCKAAKLPIVQAKRRTQSRLKDYTGEWKRTPDDEGQAVALRRLVPFRSRTRTQRVGYGV